MVRLASANQHDNCLYQHAIAKEDCPPPGICPEVHRPRQSFQGLCHHTGHPQAGLALLVLWNWTLRLSLQIQPEVLIAKERCLAART